ncbi:Na+/H+ antiporter NhaC family protein [Alicyclobacillus sp. ALC3]|uniref:Na+/H+ antiporter NhaC family protein n=1 Tax=Alicyclobacillus sp. ALC3 TaxID=2796143 RepID=UPI0023794275|nr:Na+/H+ antiporter NhaC family protein [Alicyclobacillus sp. ALC3]
MYASFWSLLPFLMVIPIALWTRQVLPGLMVGLLVGSYMTHPTLLGGISATLGYILKELAIPDNLRLLVFLYGFGSFVGLVRVTGGVSGFAAWVSKRIRTTRAAFAMTWLSSFATFMAPDFRIITVAPVMKSVFERLHVSTERVAYVIDLTSTPLIAIVPIGTAFVGYMVGLLQTSSRHHGLALTSFQLFLQTIPLNFFSIAMIALGLFQTFWRSSPERAPAAAQNAAPEEREQTNRDQTGAVFGPARPTVYARGLDRRERPIGRRGWRVSTFRAKVIGYAPVEAGDELTPARSAPVAQATAARQNSERRAAQTDTKQAVAQETKTDVTAAPQVTPPEALEVLSEQARPNVWNLAVPLVILLVLTLWLTWWNGHFHSPTLFGALAAANASQAMLQALLITLVVMVVWYSVGRLPISRTMFGFVAGGNEMMSVLLLLALVWAVSAVSTDLGFSVYVQRAIGHLVPGAFIAPALFVFGCLISYVIGSSFGTWGILLPLGFTLANSTHASLALVAGAVFASGTFGGFASPLSDNTVAMATVMKLPTMAYAHYKLKPALLAAGVSTVAYGLVGWLAPGV